MRGQGLHNRCAVPINECLLMFAQQWLSHRSCLSGSHLLSSLNTGHVSRVKFIIIRSNVTGKVWYFSHHFSSMYFRNISIIRNMEFVGSIDLDLCVSYDTKHESAWFTSKPRCFCDVKSLAWSFAHCEYRNQIQNFPRISVEAKYFLAESNNIAVPDLTINCDMISPHVMIHQCVTEQVRSNVIHFFISHYRFSFSAF